MSRLILTKICHFDDMPPPEGWLIIANSEGFLRGSNLAVTWQPLPSPGRGFCFHALFAMNRNARAHQGRLAWLCLKAAQPGTLRSLAKRSEGNFGTSCTILAFPRVPFCALFRPPWRERWQRLPGYQGEAPKRLEACFLRLCCPPPVGYSEGSRARVARQACRRRSARPTPFRAIH